MVPFQIVTSWSQWSELLCNRWWMTIAGDCLEVFSFAVMQSPFGFANVEILTVPATSFLHVYILGDPEAVSRVGRKGGTNVFKYGRKSPWVPTLTELFPNIQADAGSWLGTKNALYYCAQSANSLSWVVFVSSYMTTIFAITACLDHAPKRCTQSGNFCVWYKIPIWFRNTVCPKTKDAFPNIQAWA